ncbi:MAG TPA: SDR family oxidoreductase [Thermoplasmata archaeon]|nr:SDR family oxidoreductase [Thermoplasmata archaeon]
MTAPDSARRRVALVTGASRGLGATVARFLALEGFELLLTSRSPGPLGQVEAELRSLGKPVTVLAGAVEDPTHRRALARRVESMGRLDLLVNNASELGASPLPSLLTTPLDSFRRVLDVNVLAPLALVQELVEPLSRSGGLVVNVSSDAALGGYPGWGAYGASKAALDLLSKTLAGELEARHVAVVSVDPGDMRTAMHQAAFPGEDISDRPDPRVTLPFWAWLLERRHEEVTGHRFQAQGERWEVSA